MRLPREDSLLTGGEGEGKGTDKLITDQRWLAVGSRLGLVSTDFLEECCLELFNNEGRAWAWGKRKKWPG